VLSILDNNGTLKKKAQHWSGKKICNSNKNKKKRVIPSNYIHGINKKVKVEN